MEELAHRVRSGIPEAMDWLEQSRQKVLARPALLYLACALAGVSAVGVLLSVLVAGWALLVVAPEVGPLVEARAVPSRLYSSPLELDHERAIEADDLTAYLWALGYREAAPGEAGTDALRRGWFFRHQADGLDVVSFKARRSIHPQGPPTGAVVVVGFDGDRIERLRLEDVEVESISLEPVELASFLDPQRQEIRPLDGEELPANVARAILAAEDDGFEHHGGISLLAIVRAALKDLRAGEVRQGGSTISQQVARNRFLSHERTFERKVREAVMALILEHRYSKAEILSAYADLVYLGVRDGANVVGVGAAAYAYFGKRADDLTLAEAATLAGMIAAPGRYSPLSNGERARARRDWVLGRMRELSWIDDVELQRAKSEPLRVAFTKHSPTEARFYSRTVAWALEEEAELGDPEYAGYRIDGTLDWLDQRRAETIVKETVAALSKNRSRTVDDDLETALLSLDPRSGSVLAYVGGSDYDRSQFDRVRQARRQIGSLFKPVVYATAYERAVATPSTTILDLPLALSYGDEVWAPDNSDGTYHGTVSVQRALELSLNAATLRLAIRTGLLRVRDVAHDLGLPASDEPSMVLGSTVTSVWEVARAYSVFADGGLRREIRLVRRVFDRKGHEVVLPSNEPRRVLRERTVRELTEGLQGVLTRGTGARARRLGLSDPLAGKTGTSNERRDSWFAGFSPERLTVVWVGHDSFSPTPFTATSGALPAWTSFTLAARPHDGYRPFPPAEEESRVALGEECAGGPSVAPRARTAARQPQRAENCAPAIGYEAWRTRYGLLAALQAPPIREHQNPRDESTSRLSEDADERALASAELDYELREVLRLDGPLGHVVNRRVRWVAVSSG